MVANISILYAKLLSTVLLLKGTHKSLKGNARALSTVTAIIDGTGSVGKLLFIYPQYAIRQGTLDYKMIKIWTTMYSG